MAQRIDFQPVPRCSGRSAFPQRRQIVIFFKKMLFTVDGGGCPANLLARLKRDSRVERQQSWFSHILGLQIGTQFCPALMNPAKTRGSVEPDDKVGFFCAPKYA
jgi:hypothetical protein